MLFYITVYKLYKKQIDVTFMNKHFLFNYLYKIFLNIFASFHA